MNIFFKKAIIFSIVFLLVFNSYGLLKSPKKAEAFACANCSQLWLQITEAATAVENTVGGWIRWLEEKIGRSLRDVIAKRIIDYIVDQTIVWVQGGGEPKFVTDWGKFLRDAGEIAQDEVIRQVGLAPLCSPFKLQVQLSLLPVQKFQKEIECTLDDIVENIEDFYADFSKGGWIAYNESWAPQNNYWGTMLMVHDEMIQKQALAQITAEREAMASQGWLGVKTCLQKDQEWIASCINSRDYATDEQIAQWAEDCKQQAPCTPGQEKIVTPGHAVGKVVGEAITSDSRWAENIQSWTSGLVNALINRLTKEGIAKLQGSDSGTGATYQPPEYRDLISAEYEKEKQSMISGVQKFINEWQYLLSAKNKSLSYVQQQKGILEQLKQIQSTTTPLPPACTPQITDTEIQNLQNEIGRLTNEVQDLQVNLNEANSVINQIKNADFSRVRERSLAQAVYNGFINKYNTNEILGPLISGEARKAADDEAKTKLDELTVSQNRLTTCQSALSTSP